MDSSQTWGGSWYCVAQLAAMRFATLAFFFFPGVLPGSLRKQCYFSQQEPPAQRMSDSKKQKGKEHLLQPVKPWSDQTATQTPSAPKT